MSEQESWVSQNLIWIVITGFIIFGVTAFVIIGHDRLVISEGIDKSTIQWIDSQTECRWLKQYDTDLGVHDRWIKSSSDNELIKKMEELKC